MLQIFAAGASVKSSIDKGLRTLKKQGKGVDAEAKGGYNIRMKENELNLTLPIFILVSFMSICAFGACAAIVGAILEAL